MSEFRQTNVSVSGRVNPVQLDHQQCYDAMSSRDSRFDGRFWIGVATTGVYCRPVCPSRTPLSRNVTFYAHPAAAEDAGFRPCRRCQPDAAPGSAAWRGGAEVVDRALRLIAQGALDTGSVDVLAARLHVGGRHLRRLFHDHVGTGPDAVARTRRAHLARRLLIDTSLPVADVAFAAGFGSVRQCNDVVRATFHATPTQVRSARSSKLSGVAGERLRIRVPVRAPFDGEGILIHLAGRAVPGIESVDSSGYERVLRLGDDVGAVGIELAEGGLAVSVDASLVDHLGALVAGVRRLVDADADPVAVQAHLGTDADIGQLVASRPGLRVPGSWSGFEAAVRAVVGQQISVAGATTVVGRIVAAFGAGAFPSPEDLVEAEMEPLGLIGRRAATIRSIARRMLDGDLALDGTVPLVELEAELVAIAGVGPWTASAIALRIGEPDAFPAGDLHIRRALDADTRTASQIAERWRPWRSYAAAHLWAAASSAAA